MLSNDQVLQIRKLIGDGLPKKEIAQRMQISIGSVYKHDALLRIADFKPAEHVSESTSADTTSKILKPYIHIITEQISRKVYNASKIYKILLTAGYEGSYILVNNFVRKKELERGGKKIRFFRRVETDPGEQAQVDWGHFGKIVIDGKLHNLYIFVYVLSYSRMMYAEFAVSQKQRTFLECHIQAFEKLGVPKKIRYDNVKTVVTSREKVNGEIIIHYNFDFLNFAQHYKFRPEACHPYYPQSKGKVEAGVKFLRNNFMTGQTLKRMPAITIAGLNEKVWQWLEFVNQRKHSTTNERPFDRWQREKEHLFFTDTVPRYQNYSLSSRRASRISMVTYKRSSYWVPPQYARKKINIKEVENNGMIHLEFQFRGKKVITWPLASKLGSWIVPNDEITLPSTQAKNSKKETQKSQLRSIQIETRDLSYYNKFIDI